MQSQHPQHWARYSALTSKEEKSSFFTNNAPVVHWNTICSHFVGSQAHIHYFVNTEIINIIIGEMLFHPDDTNKEITKERALSIFEDVAGPDQNAQDSDLRTDCYQIVIKNPIQFCLLIGFVGGGASF